MSNLYGKHIICCVTNDLSTDQRMHKICTTLSAHGAHVTLVGRLRKNSKPLQEFNFDCHRIKCNSERGFWFYAEYNWKLKKYLSRQKPDVICAIDLDTMLAAKYATKKKGAKWVYDAHEYYTESPELDHRPWVKAFWSRIGFTTVAQADLAYTVNIIISQLLSDLYNRPFGVVRNLPRYKIPLETVNDKIILYQGVLNKGRGLASLIKAMQRIEDLKLVLIGDGDIRHELQSLTTRLDLDDKIEFLGSKLPEELATYTNKAWLGINILDPKNKNYKYSLANKFFDYMMAGIPSISMSFVEYERVVSQYPIAMLIHDLEVDTLVCAIKKLQDDQSLYHSLKSASIKAAKEYNWESEQKVLIDMYEALLSTP